MPEPRDPLLKVLIDYMYHSDARDARVMKVSTGGPDARRPGRPRGNRVVSTGLEVGPEPTLSNDPSAGSPTETLLRLLLPLNDSV